MFAITDGHGIYWASDLAEAERILLADPDRPARLYGEDNTLIPFTWERGETGHTITYPRGIESIGVAAGSQFFKPFWN